MYEIISILQSNPIFKYIEILDLIDEENVKLIKIKTILQDKSELFITELFTGNVHKYSYHWQDKRKVLISRWDNKPHWKKIDTFPHHKHQANKVLASYSINSEEIINEIIKLYQKRRRL